LPVYNSVLTLNDQILHILLRLSIWMVKTMPTYLDFVRYEYNGGGILLYLICDKSKTLTEVK
jgi:hypothetical protein